MQWTTREYFSKNLPYFLSTIHNATQYTIIQNINLPYFLSTIHNTTQYTIIQNINLPYFLSTVLSADWIHDDDMKCRHYLPR